MCVTRVVGQCLGRPIFAWGDQVPDEAFDVLITAVMQQAVGQEGSADGLHISLLQGALEATMSQDVTPPTPTKDREKGTTLSVPGQTHLIFNTKHRFNSTRHCQSGTE